MEAATLASCLSTERRACGVQSPRNARKFTTDQVHDYHMHDMPMGVDWFIGCAMHSWAPVLYAWQWKEEGWVCRCVNGRV